MKLQRANPQLRAIVLLAANCAFGAADISALPRRAVDLEKGWLEFPRPKTAVRRRIPLWPETVKAIRNYLPQRPKPVSKSDEQQLFLTSRGLRWVKVHPETGAASDALGAEFNKLLARLALKRPKVGLCAIRHTFETIGGESIDQVAVDAQMGHVPQGMAGEYRERISDDRLKKVSDVVREWVFTTEEPVQGPGSDVEDSKEEIARVIPGKRERIVDTPPGSKEPRVGREAGVDSFTEFFAGEITVEAPVTESAKVPRLRLYAV